MAPDGSAWVGVALLAIAFLLNPFWPLRNALDNHSRRLANDYPSEQLDLPND
jgi:hypothetical protein